MKKETIPYQGAIARMHIIKEVEWERACARVRARFRLASRAAHLIRSPFEIQTVPLGSRHREQQPRLFAMEAPTFFFLGNARNVWCASPLPCLGCVCLVQAQ